MLIGNGLLARQRKEELQRVKEQLRQINVALRRQAKIESYAPSLSYVPIGEFKTALELAKSLKDPIEEKKAARGLGTSLKRQGKYQEAIKYHSMVLVISDREGEDSGNTEAYGAIADYYTELGDLEKAGILYDKYIARLETDLRKLHNPPVLPPFNGITTGMLPLLNATENARQFVNPRPVVQLVSGSSFNVYCID
ncbi:hypothetical protein GOBAR_DD28868 [Gossypium barbadense]|nr:hypothetical protein GOBAR_DD28868 [Gossypium barbadense]